MSELDQILLELHAAAKDAEDDRLEALIRIAISEMEALRIVISLYEKHGQKGIEPIEYD